MLAVLVEYGFMDDPGLEEADQPPMNTTART